MGRTFVFRSGWDSSWPPDRVLDLFADLAGYPRWWPAVRDVVLTDDDTARVRIRSWLPVTLTLELTREQEARGAGLLRVALAGDLSGHVAVQVIPVGSGSRVVWTQEASVTHATLGRVADLPLGRWLLRANHAVMMRAVALELR